MRRIGKWSVTVGTLAFAGLPLLAAGCAENQAIEPPPTASDTSATDTMNDDLGDLGDLPDDLGDPAESGSGLGLPEAGSGLGLPEAGSGLGPADSDATPALPDEGSEEADPSEGESADE